MNLTFSPVSNRARVIDWWASVLLAALGGSPTGRVAGAVGAVGADGFMKAELCFSAKMLKRGKN